MGNSLAYFMLELGNAKPRTHSHKGGKTSFKTSFNHGVTGTCDALRLAKVRRLFSHFVPPAKVGAIHRGHRVDIGQFPSLSGVSRYPADPTACGKYQTRCGRCSLGLKLGCFQRWNPSRRTGWVRMAQKITVAHDSWPPWEKAGQQRIFRPAEQPPEERGFFRTMT